MFQHLSDSDHIETIPIETREIEMKRRESSDEDMEQGFLDEKQENDVVPNDVTNHDDVITLDEENKMKFINALVQDYEDYKDEEEDSESLESYLKKKASSESSDVTSSSSESSSSSREEEDEDKPDHERRKHHGEGSFKNDVTCILSCFHVRYMSWCYRYFIMDGS